MSDARLAELAAAVGLQLDWQDANGRPQRVDPEVQRGLLEALGYPAQSPQQIEQSLAALARLREDSANLGLLVGECGQPLEQALGPAGTPGELVYEDGTRIALRLDAEGRLPAQARSGYAQLSLEQREWAVAMAPPSLPVPGQPRPGSLASLGSGRPGHALRRPGDGGLGDSAALEDLLRSAARHGADALAISPLHALAEANGHAYSPYSPSSRLFFNVLHAAPATILGAAAVEQAIRRAGLAAEMARLESLERSTGQRRRTCACACCANSTATSPSAPVPCATTSPNSAAKPARPCCTTAASRPCRRTWAPAPTGDAGRSRCAAPASRRWPRSAPITPRKWTSAPSASG